MRYNLKEFLAHKDITGIFWHNHDSKFSGSLAANKLCSRNHPLTCIDIAFDFDNTREGRLFWEEISREWKQFIQSYRKQIVMKTAHEFKRELGLSLSEAMKKAWKEFQF